MPLTAFQGLLENELPFSWRDEETRVLRLLDERRACVQAGNFRKAEAISQQIAAGRQSIAAAQDEERRRIPPPPRPPAEGEERKLETRLESYNRQIARLEEKRQSTLLALSEKTESSLDFSPVADVDNHLADVRWRMERIRLRLSEIDTWHANEKRDRIAAEIEARNAFGDRVAWPQPSARG